VKRLNTWDTYVREALTKGDRSIEIPLTADETYVVPFPTRRQGRAIADAQQNGDTDAMLIALLGEEAGTRVRELAEDQPTYVLDDFLVDVMRKFGMLPDDVDPTEETPSKPAKATVNGQVNGEKRPARTRAVVARKPSGRSSAASK
jgi:hypothetical protein